MTEAPQFSAIFALASFVHEEANSLILALLAQRGIHDLLPVHGLVLHALFTQSPLRMSAVAKMIRRQKNTVTSLIKTLEERGYCERKADPDDSRVQLVALTEKGEATRPHYLAVSEEALRRAWSGVSEKEQDACTHILTEVLKNIKKPSGPSDPGS